MLRIRQIVILVILIVSYSCHEFKTTFKTSPQSDSLTMHLKAFSQSSPIPGFAVGILNEEGLQYEAAFGWADRQKRIAFTPETIHAVASVSKTFLAVCVLKLVEEGKLKLDEPINDILPFPIINPHFPNTPIRVKHLLNHTSSIIDDAFIPYYIGEADICILNDNKAYDSLPKHLLLDVQYYRMGKKISLEQFIRNYTQKAGHWNTDSTFLDREPGTYFEYSNLAASIVALLVEIRSGLSFRDFSRYAIFDPLHLNHTAWDYDSLPANSYSKIYAQEDPLTDSTVREFPFYYMLSYPSSELKTNIHDLSVFLAEMIHGYNGHGKLLTPEMYKQLFQPVTGILGLDTNDSSRFNSHFSIASFWSVSATGHRMHFGGRTGTYAFMYFNPKTNRGSIAYANLRHNSFGDLLEIVGNAEEGWK